MWIILAPDANAMLVLSPMQSTLTLATGGWSSTPVQVRTSSATAQLLYRRRTERWGQQRDASWTVNVFFSARVIDFFLGGGGLESSVQPRLLMP